MIDNLVIGAGAMKAGTTWLYKQLDVHPNIHFTPEKEIHYFSYNEEWGDKLDSRDRNRRLNRAIRRDCAEKVIQWYKHYAQPGELDDQWYCNLFNGVPDDVYCADFSNQYSLLEEESLEQIKKVAKNIKVIYTLREPLERLWSHVKFHYKFNGQEDRVDNISIKAFRRLIELSWFWKNAEYVANYDRLVNVFGESNVKLFYLEDFIALPQNSLWCLEDFLAIQHIEFKDEAAKKKVNKTKELAMPSQWQRIAMIKLRPQYQALSDRGLSHPSWHC
ncbi:MAG: sulfotransferase [Methylovulum sp.]|nr:sulfotransferase [Methylovulum sp.]